MKFNIGDRVKELSNLKDRFKHEKARCTNLSENDCYKIVIIDAITKHGYNNEMMSLYHVKYLDVYNARRSNLSLWVEEGDIILDREYHRNEKLNQLVN